MGSTPDDATTVDAVNPIASAVPDNAALRAAARVGAFTLANDPVGMATVYRHDVVVEDRRVGLRSVVTGADAIAAVTKGLSAVRDITSTPMATRGDNLSLAAVTFTGTSAYGVDFETPTLQVVQVDADGHVVRHVTFDVSDVDAAFSEIHRLDVAGGT